MPRAALALLPFAPFLRLRRLRARRRLRRRSRLALRFSLRGRFQFLRRFLRFLGRERVLRLLPRETRGPFPSPDLVSRGRLVVLRPLHRGGFRGDARGRRRRRRVLPVRRRPPAPLRGFRRRAAVVRVNAIHGHPRAAADGVPREVRHLRLLHRLDEVILRARFRALRLELVRVHGAHHDDRDRPERLIAALDDLHELEAVHLGHHDVGQDQVDRAARV